MGVCIGVAAVERPSWAFVDSLLQLRKGGAWNWRRVGPLAVDKARNRLCAEFLRTEDEWLLMVDADATLHPLTLLRLLSWQRPVVGALAFSRYGPMFPTVYRGQPQAPEKRGFLIQVDAVRSWLQEHPEMIGSEARVKEPQEAGDLVEVDRTGAHCLLIQREVLEAIRPPWFVSKDDGPDSTGLGVGEDFYFCGQVQEAGYPIYVDMGCMAGHAYGERILASRDFLVWDYASSYGED